MTAMETEQYRKNFLLEVIENNTDMEFERISKKRLRDVLTAEKQDVDDSLPTDKLKEKVIDYFLSYRKKLKCHHCKKIGHEFEGIFKCGLRCSKCKIKGHREKCGKRTQYSHCFNCDRIGHWVKDCPEKKYVNCGDQGHSQKDCAQIHNELLNLPATDI